MTVTIDHLIASATAKRLGIDNKPSKEDLERLELLLKNIIKPIEEQFGSIIINSGYRCPALNKAVGGAEASQHMIGQAVDLEVPGVANFDLFEWIRKYLPFDQLLLEFHDPKNPSSGWVHVSYANRGQAKTLPKG